MAERTQEAPADRRSPAKHAAILRAATEVFLREGYARASVDLIAATAKVGKQTVYGHFGDKESLFLAVVRDARAAIDPADVVADTGDARADLTAAARAIVTVIASPHVQALHSLTIAELPHHPQLQQSWRDDGTVAAVDQAVAGYLARCDDRGELSVPDPPLAARHFTQLLGAEAQVRSLRGLEPLSERQIAEIADQVTDLIMRAYRP